MMRVAGLGFRAAATEHSLSDAVRRLGDEAHITHLAALSDKHDADALRTLAASMKLEILAVPRAAIAGLETETHAPRIVATFATGSVCEALALTAAGPNARLIVVRQISIDGLATAALAEGQGP